MTKIGNWGSKAIIICETAGILSISPRYFWFTFCMPTKVLAISFGGREIIDWTEANDRKTYTFERPKKFDAWDGDAQLDVTTSTGEKIIVGNIEIIHIKDALSDLGVSTLSNSQRKIAEHLLRDEHPSLSFFIMEYAKQEKLYWQPILSWIDEMPKGGSLLDIGPGYGTLLHYTCGQIQPSHVAAVDKIDFLARSLVDELKIDYQIRDLETDHLEFASQFDLILLTEIVEHFNFNIVPTMKKVRDLLKPNGQILLSTPDADEWGRVLTYYKSWDAIPIYEGQQMAWIDGHIWQFCKSELDEVFHQCGLKLEKFAYSPGTNHRHLCFALTNVSVSA